MTFTTAGISVAVTHATSGRRCHSVTWQARSSTVLRAGTPGAIGRPLGSPERKKERTDRSSDFDRVRSRKCHVSRLRLRGQRLTGTSGRGLSRLSVGCRLPAWRSRPHLSDSQASAPRPTRGRSRAGKNAAPCLGHDAPPSLLASVLSWWFLPSASSSRLSALSLALSQTPTIPCQPRRAPSSCPSRGYRPPAAPQSASRPRTGPPRCRGLSTATVSTAPGGGRLARPGL